MDVQHQSVGEAASEAGGGALSMPAPQRPLHGCRTGLRGGPPDPCEWHPPGASFMFSVFESGKALLSSTRRRLASRSLVCWMSSAKLLGTPIGCQKLVSSIIHIALHYHARWSSAASASACGRCAAAAAPSPCLCLSLRSTRRASCW